MNISRRWVVKEPNKPSEEFNLEVEYEDLDERADKELKTAQKLVDGYVEVAHIGGKVKVLCNEDGLYKGLAQNCGFLGTLVFFRETFDVEGEAEWGSLTDEDVRKIKVWEVLRAKTDHPGSTTLVISGDENIAAYKRDLARHHKSLEEEWKNL